MPPGLLRRIGLLTGPAVWITMLNVPAPPGLSDAGWAVGAVAAWMMVWWVTEAVALAATALLPVVLLPMLNIGSVEQITQSYTHPLIFMFLGGFMIARALERWGLHLWIAAAILKMGPKGPAGLVGSLMAATGFLSMWISNTAAAMVMVPIGQSVIRSMHDQSTPVSTQTGISAAMMLGIAFAATVGGMATLIGTPPNALLAGYLQTAHGMDVGFGQWMLVGVPVVVILLPVTWFVLTLVFDLGAIKAPGLMLKVSMSASPEKPLTLGARITACIVSLAGMALVLRPLLHDRLPGLPLSDTAIVMTAALLLFCIPASADRHEMLLEWEDAKTIRWDVLILFGGGLALAGAIDASGLSVWIGDAFSQLGHLPMPLIILLIMAAMVLLGELASNTAMAAVFLPVAGAVAIGLGGAPIDLILPVGLAASLGFMLPVATPPNAIAYGSGEVTSGQMLKAGVMMDAVAIAIVYIIAVIVGPMVF